MNKKLILLLLPLTLAMISCGKDLEPKVDKVDLVRLLDDSEVAFVFAKVKENYTNKLSSVEVNYALIDDDLINQRSETTISSSIKIKGDGYAEGKGEMVSKVKNNFYTYTTKTISENKVASFGNYYITLNESYKEGQKDIKNTYFEYSEANGKKITEMASSGPISQSNFSSCTFGVDRSNNVYAVYSKENTTSVEGRDKDGKDATFIDKSTSEIFAKFGNLKDPKIESYKTVTIYETNYDEELTIYKKYQTVGSNVISYKFEYKNRDNNDGLDKFINSLPEKYVTAADVTVISYGKNGGANTYSEYTSSSASVSAFKGNYSSELFAFKANSIAFSNSFAYGFSASYVETSINKSSQSISSEIKNATVSNIYTPDDMETFNATLVSGTKELVKVKEGATSTAHRVDFLFDPSSSNMIIYII